MTSTYNRLQGVPIRLEIGPKDIQNRQVLAARRDTSAKSTISRQDISSAIPTLLDTIQSDMYNRAKAVFEQRLVAVTKWEDVVPTLDNKCIIVIPWCEVESCEDDIKERSGRA